MPVSSAKRRNSECTDSAAFQVSHRDRRRCPYIVSAPCTAMSSRRVDWDMNSSLSGRGQVISERLTERTLPRLKDCQLEFDVSSVISIGLWEMMSIVYMPFVKV